MSAASVRSHTAASPLATASMSAWVAAWRTGSTRSAGAEGAAADTQSAAARMGHNLMGERLHQADDARVFAGLGPGIRIEIEVDVPVVELDDDLGVVVDADLFAGTRADGASLEATAFRSIEAEVGARATAVGAAAFAPEEEAQPVEGRGHPLEAGDAQRAVSAHRQPRAHELGELEVRQAALAAHDAARAVPRGAALGPARVARPAAPSPELAGLDAAKVAGERPLGFLLGDLEAGNELVP